jgi:hypothetical protein
MSLIDSVIIWVFVGAFAAVVIGAVLAFLGVPIIPDPEQRKWAFRSVLAVMVVAVISYGANKFFNPDNVSAEENTKAADDQSPNPTATESKPGGTDKPSTPVPPTTPKTDGKTPIEVPPSTPNAILEWAKVNMPTRPRILSEFDTGYPNCAAKLIGDTASITKSTAAQFG